MLRPLAIGLPIILVVVIGFVVGMNTVPFSSPYFKFVIIGYVVLFPAALLYTIIGTIRSAKRMMAGGDVSLKARGERTMATVVASRPLNMTIRMGGGMRHSMAEVRLKPDNRTPEIRTTKAGNFFAGPPAVGDRVPLYLDTANPKNFFVDWDESSGSQRVTASGEIGDLVSQIQAAMAQAGAVAQGVAVNIGGTQFGQAAHQAPQQSYQPPQQQHYEPPPVSEGPAGGAIEGRARIEGLKPYPDGTYDLDLYVTPKGKSSYRVAARVPVPAGTGVLQKGQMLEVRVDPDIASRIEVVWG
ncbi:MAG: hypothetical protein QM698_15580 [Micropepsaceae bacterium]